MRLSKTSPIGLCIGIALACSPARTSDQAPVAAEGATPAAAAAPDAAIGIPAVSPVLRAEMLAPAQWTATNWSAGNSFFDLSASQDRAFARIWDSQNGGRMFLTADGGTSWVQIGSADGEMDILSIVSLPSGLVAGTWNGLYLSTSAGANWNALSPTGLPADTAILSLAKFNNALFAGTIGHIYRSTDDGATFTEVSSGIGASALVNSFVASGSAILAGSHGDGVFRTTNGGASWAAANGGLTDTRISELTVLGSKVFAVTLTGVFVSSDSGASWVADNSGLTNINALAALGTDLLAGTEADGVYSSSDGGASWTAFTTGLPAGARIWSLAATNDNVFAATDSGIWRSPLVPNDPPTIVTAAAASPNPVTGTTTSLSALGADDAGEANLTYTWATSGAPPAAISFSANGSNAAKNTTATFSNAGNYTLVVTVADQGGRATTSQITVTVNQTLSSVAVSPNSATVSPAGTQQFSASAIDQFGANLATQPTFTWSVNGGGSISSSGLFTAGTTAGGPYTLTATSGGASGGASVIVSATPTTVYQIDCGGNATAPFIADQYVSGGSSYTVTNAINTSGITDPAPQAVYQSERYGNSTYTLPNLTPGSQYTVRLHFAELYWTATGKRVFNVAINGATALSNFDTYAAAGAQYKAVVREFTTTANASGQIVIAFTTVTDNASIEGIEVISSTPNYAPTIATAASATPNPGSASSAALSVLGADDGGEANLTYTWATTGTPPAGVTFSINGSNAAKNTTVTFTKAGSYTLQATVRDAPGLTTTSQVVVTVDQALTSIVVAPGSTSLAPLATQQFTATALDQFATALTTQPTFTWSVSGGGTISSSGLFTAGTTAGGPYTVTAQSGATSGAATVSVTIPNLAPTISAPAAAAPDPVTGNAAALSVLGEDDGDEANLIYTWAATGTPPAPVSFGANASNAAKNTTATFSKAGSYTFVVTVADQPGLSTTSQVTVTVNQTLTSIVVAPTSASIKTAASQQFSATARDQFGASLATQPTFTWNVSGGGTISSSGLFTAGTSAGGPYTVTATSGGVSGSASVTVSATPTTVYQIDCGGNATAPFIADQYVSGGSKYTVTNAINTSGVTNPAPQGVYQTERYGNSTYTLPNLTVGSQYTVRLHFAELYWTATGKRVFNVAINGATVLSNFDTYAAAGAQYKAVVREFTTTASASGQIVIAFTTVTDNASIDGIEVISSTPNYPPTIATAASATPNPGSASSAALSVLGADDGGEANLTYTWATTGTPPAGVTFSINGNNAAKNTTVTFTKAGSYTLQATVRDAPGLTTTSQVVVTVDQALTSIVVAPASASLAPLATQQFTATALDQFATALTTQPTFTWSVSGGGTISSSGLFTAGTSAGGPYTVTATSGTLNASASLTISQPNTGPTIATPAAANPNPISATTTALSVLGDDDGGEGNLSYTWTTTGTPPATVTFSANGSNAAKATTATFSKAGSYAFQVTVKDQGNLTATSAVTVTVNQTLTSIVVSPSSATVSPSATQQFTATARDQFATNLTTQPTFTWSVSGGGTISSSGLFTAGTSAGGPYAVTAASGGKSGTASITVAQSIIHQINCGGSASSPYSADQYYSGGTARTVSNNVTTTGVTNPAPQAVYRAERYGNSTYTLPNLTAGASYLVRLHFAELYWTATGKRRFNVTINGTTVLSNFDIYATAGAQYKAVVREFSTTANASGQIVVKLTTVTDNASIEGIQIIRQ